MKLSKKTVEKIVKEEVQLFLEACGCGSPAMPARDPMVIPLEMVAADEMEDDHHDDVGEFDRSEALDLISLIARKTSCPATRQALMDVVSDLGGEEDFESHDLEDISGDPEAWASGDFSTMHEEGG